MNKKLLTGCYSLLIVSIVLFIMVSISQDIYISYSFSLIFFISLFLLTYITGLISNKNTIYRRNIDIYIFLYFVLLMCLTMFISRTTIKLIDDTFLQYYFETINVTPFKTIMRYLKSNLSSYIIMYNVLGNFVALMPLSLLLVLKSDRYKKFVNQFFTLGFIVLSIELLQLLLSAGRFDIDDFILNIGGSMIFFIIIKNFNLIEKIKKLFYTDFKLNKKIKYILFSLLSIIIIGLDISLILELIV
ncbi:MAG: VanZ family protein [Bacilli bacterium]|nr:VanZ family protein [Bacilli bacterium]